MTDAPTRIWNDLVVPAPGTYELDVAHQRIGFLAMHMMVSPVRGQFGTGSAVIHVAEDPLASTVAASIDAASIETAHADRDAHLKSPDFLDVDVFPTIEFRSTGVEWNPAPDPIFSWAALKGRLPGRDVDTQRATAGSRTRFVLHGHLTIRGVTHPIALDAEFGGVGTDPYGRHLFGFSATADFEREKFGLLWNVALEAGGVLVAKTVRIELAGEAIRVDG
ncbi:polyisoprenoid-binding protein YceI [Isoptericola sp. CG 20/1183]|uniref:Polyisoprenoid-binding protein YceI n=1 Tax=Isoptericola halotolerans TaxID=300560 RepID=A0ABX5EIG9_9MICO|nr:MULTISPECIES: YceI family protein [Isoptericola]PRZ08245.1 polyisoprenoid-binding protein YceI [Isoptericola halotolerans]PRZ09042.1 polyisoprenoid-binding protein YceI [Isoptericola sp. CG 20/1183]